MCGLVNFKFVLVLKIIITVWLSTIELPGILRVAMLALMLQESVLRLVGLPAVLYITHISAKTEEMIYGSDV